ncbi:NAD(P)/FAD-dependent oxidoreductase [Amycolatopsis dongchuanensis]|uniref:FAD-dependent oxidoreductase n=1 Tax=Amycolatopsis dongchuanensis TaxID=1070866 RepID=A0ABP9QAR4_9PSEU
MTTRRHVVVVGASQAGCACTNALRGLGFDGDITMVGAEPHPPYTRPPLSKGVLVGSEPDDSVFLPVPGDAEVLTGVGAIGLDREKNLVELTTGDKLRYDGLVIASGARARLLGDPGQGEITLRGLDDAVALRTSLAGARDVAVAGGGFLGMELASSAAALGKSVTVVDVVTPLLSRLGPALSALCLEAAADHGVRVRVTGTGLRVGFTDGRPSRLTSADGTFSVDADLAVTAVGDVPNTEWLHGTGLPLENGVVTDEACRVAPGIVAAGDVTSVRRDGGHVRTPHWSNALSQAKIAAAALLGREPERPARGHVPFFWTEAFGLKIRLAGHLPPAGEPTVLEGSLAGRRALLVWPGTAAAVNFPAPAPKLAKLAQQLPTH